MSYIYTSDNGNPIGKANPLPVTVGSSVVEDVSLVPTNTTTVVAGASKLVASNKSIRIEVWGTGTYVVDIQGFGDSGTPRSLPIWDISGMKFLDNNNIVGSGFYEIDVQGFKSIRGNVKSISGGNVNASGRWMN